MSALLVMHVVVYTTRTFTSTGNCYIPTLADSRLTLFVAQSQFNVVGIAARAGYVFRAALEFSPGDFPGYEHFRTLTGEAVQGADEDEDAEDADELKVAPADDDVAVGAKTLIFQLAEKSDAKKARGRGAEKGEPKKITKKVAAGL